MSALACPSLDAPPRSIAEAISRIAGETDAVAWSWLVEHEGPAMFRVAERVLGSAAAADDACQEAFLHLRRGAHRFRAPSEGNAEAAAHTWLLRIAANAAAMQARTERRRSRREQQLPIDQSTPAVDGAPERVEALRMALAELPDSQRQPLVLHHLAGQDYSAIGAALGISAGAARVRAHRGIEQLRSRLAQAGVLVAATGLLGQLGASETAVPAGACVRWSTLLSSTSTPAATSAAIFGGISIMAKITLFGVALSAATLLTISVVPARAAEHVADKPKVEVPAPAGGEKKVEPKKEAHDAMAEGTKGVSEGVIVSIEKGKVVLKTADGDLLFAAHWRGGNPKDGGGLDKPTLEKLQAFKAGDRVSIAWTWSERRRIETITKVKPAE